MNKTQEKLKKETEKWLEKLEEKLMEKKEVEDLDSVDEMENVEAYRSDTYHFLEEEDFIQAWESVIYAWGILETLERLGLFKEKD
ncbi:MAG: DUF357 domain-containing protein [Candidatus Nanohaloarchaea archaeon]